MAAAVTFCSFFCCSCFCPLPSCPRADMSGSIAVRALQKRRQFVERPTPVNRSSFRVRRLSFSISHVLSLLDLSTARHASLCFLVLSSGACTSAQYILITHHLSVLSHVLLPALSPIRHGIFHLLLPRKSISDLSWTHKSNSCPQTLQSDVRIVLDTSCRSTGLSLKFSSAALCRQPPTHHFATMRSLKSNTLQP